MKEKVFVGFQTFFDILTAILQGGVCSEATSSE